MLDDAEDDALPDDGPTSGVAAEAARLAKVGELGQARDLLAAADVTSDESAGRTYIHVLHSLNDEAGKQAALGHIIQGLSALPDPSDKYLEYVLRYAERTCCPPDVIDQALAFIGARARRSDELEMALQAARRRQKYRRARAPQLRHLTLISLGTRCLPWTLPNRWGMRTPEQYVGGFNPFCQSVHTLAGIIEALRTDWANYAALDQIGSVKTAKGYQITFRTDRSAVWNHHKGGYWVRDKYAELRASLQVGIDNFRATCHAENPVFILGHSTVRYPDEKIELLAELQDALRIATGRPQNHLLIMNQRAPDQGIERPFTIDSHTKFAYTPYPSKAYNYAVGKCFNSADGLTFERGFVRTITKCLRRWGLVGKPRAGGEA